MSGQKQWLSLSLLLTNVRTSPHHFGMDLSKAISDLGKNRRRLVASQLLLVLCASLIHSCLHFCSEFDLQRNVPQNRAGSLSASSERSKQPPTRVETCVACFWQKHHSVVLAAVGVPLNPLRLDHLIVGPDRVSKSQHDLDPGLSRAPPILS